MSESIFQSNYYPYVFNFVGKWLNSYFVKKHEIVDLTFPDNNLKSDGFLIVLSILYNNPDIQSLNLKNNNLGYADFYRLRVISPKIKNLLHLILDGNQLSEESCKDLFDIIVNLHQLKTLELDSINHNNSLDNFFQLTYKHNRFKIEELSLRNNSITSPTAIHMMKFIDNFSNLKTLQLSQNKLTNGFFISLNNFFKKKRNLVSLTLENNEFEDHNFHVFCQAIQSAQSLSILNLNSNKLTEKSARQLLETIKDHKNLSKLTMNANKINNSSLPNLINTLLKHNKVIKMLDFRTLNTKMEEKKTNYSVLVYLDEIS
jgi:Ran GTPase-activating protein (RanGAP) involved in mRNA processing and transport